MLLPQVPEPGHLSPVVSPPGSPRSVISRAASGSHIATAEKAEPPAGGAARPPSAPASRDGGARLPHLHTMLTPASWICSVHQLAAEPLERRAVKAGMV